jgi:methylmalonyl-CoA mutase
MAMKKFPEKTLEDWRAIASKECKGRPLDDLNWDTPEGITVKPLYTVEDLEGMDQV